MTLRLLARVKPRFAALLRPSLLPVRELPRWRVFVTALLGRPLLPVRQRLVYFMPMVRWSLLPLPRVRVHSSSVRIRRQPASFLDPLAAHVGSIRLHLLHPRRGPTAGEGHTQDGNGSRAHAAVERGGARANSNAHHPLWALRRHGHCEHCSAEFFCPVRAQASQVDSIVRTRS